jgi:hypothetical protein
MQHLPSLMFSLVTGSAQKMAQTMCTRVNVKTIKKKITNQIFNEESVIILNNSPASCVTPTLLFHLAL